MMFKDSRCSLFGIGVAVDKMATGKFLKLLGLVAALTSMPKQSLKFVYMKIFVLNKILRSR